VTNFQTGSERSSMAWLTPERAVLAVPILAGVGLAVVLASLVITPLTVQLRNKQETVNILQGKSDALPQLIQSLAQRSQDQSYVTAQKQRLLDLIAGTTELETFLAELNDLALQHRVTLSSTAPGKVELPPPLQVLDDATAAPLAEGVDAPASSDPLLIQGLEKRTATLNVEGSFIQVLAFLQSLEQLEVFVITNDLALVSARGASENETLVRLSLKLIAYGPIIENETVKG